MNYWLMKSEPGAFSIDDLALRPRQTEPWDGVRNYQVQIRFPFFKIRCSISITCCCAVYKLNQAQGLVQGGT